MSEEELLSYWKQQSEQWELSGQTQRVFCQERNLSHNSFAYYRAKIRELERKSRGPSLSQVLMGGYVDADLSLKSEKGLEVLLPMDIRLYIKTESDIIRACSLIRKLGGK